MTFIPDPSLGQSQGQDFNQSQAALSHSQSLVDGFKPTIDAQGNQLTGIAALKQNLGALGQDTTNILPTIGAIGGGIAGGAIGGAAGIESGPGAIATGYAGAVAGSGAGAALGEAAKEKLQGQSLQGGEIAKQGGIYAGLEAIGGPVLSALGKITEAVGGGLAKMFIPKSESESGMLQAYKAGTSFMQRVGNALGYTDGKAPSSAASTAFEKGLMGSESMMGVQAKRAQSKLWNGIIAPALKQSENTTGVDMPTFFQDAEAKIKAENPELTRQSTLLNALESVKEDYKGVTRQTLTQLQKLKEGWADFVPEKAYKGQPIAGALNDVRNTLAGMAREKIYSSLGDNVKQAYFDYGNLQGITALGKKAMAGSGFKGGFGKAMSSLWEMATVPTGTIGGQTIYKVGQGVEFLGKPGARTLRDALGIPASDKQPSQADTSTFVPDPTLEQQPTQ